MDLESPKIDKRSSEDLLKEVKSLVPFYTPEWYPKERDAGLALLKIFTCLSQIIIQRLNKMPEKNLVAFLDMIGIKLLPAQPAAAPISFLLAEGTEEHVLVPERTQVAAGEVVFETGKNIFATPSRLVKAYSVDTNEDEIYESPANVVSGEPVTPFQTELLYDGKTGCKEIFLVSSEGLNKGDFLIIHKTGGSEYGIVSEVSDSRVKLEHKLEKFHFAGSPVEKATSFELFEGKNLQEHILYLGHEDLFNIKGSAIVTIDVGNAESAQELSGPSVVQWEYYGEAIRTVTDQTEEIKKTDWHPLKILTPSVKKSTQFQLQKRQQFTDECTGETWKSGEIKECSINEVKSRWIRCKTKDNLKGGAIVLNKIQVCVKPVSAPESQDSELSAEVIRRVRGILGRELFEREVNAIEEHLRYSGKGNRLAKPIRGEQEILEYSKEIAKILQKAEKPNLVEESKNAETGDSGIQGIVPDAAFHNDVPLDLTVSIYPFGKIPRLYDTFYIASQEAFSKKGTSITLHFSISRKPDDMPVANVPGISQALVKKLEGEKISMVSTLLQFTAEKLMDKIHVDKEEAVNILMAVRNVGPILSWEYWDGNGWAVIAEDFKDNAGRFLNTGSKTVEFTCPRDMQTVQVNGQDNYWIRVRIVSGDYGKEEFVEQNGTWRVDSSKINPPRITKLTITYTLPPQSVQHCLTYNNLEYKDVTEESKENTAKTFKPFLPLEDEQQTLYLGFDRKLEKGPISLFFSIEEHPELFDKTPAIEWQYYSDLSQWVRLEVLDETRGLSRSGTIECVFPPAFKKTRKFGQELYWVRAVDVKDCFKTPEKKNANDGKKPAETQVNQNEVVGPRIKGVYVNTAWAIQAETIKDEILGSSDGTKGQSFALARTPVISEEIWVNEIGMISEEEKKDVIEKRQLETEETKDEKGNVTEFWVKWNPTENLVTSSGDERHYEIDHVSGELRFGDGVCGKIPPIGTDSIKANYRTGGGSAGNLPALEVKDLKTSVPFVDKACNPLVAEGGAETEAMEKAMQRGPEILKHRDRAITAQDFEQMTHKASRSVARAKCLPNFGTGGKFEAGCVTVIVIPQTQEEKPQLSLQLRRTIEDYLKGHSANTLVERSHLHVSDPVYIEVSISATIFAKTIDAIPGVENQAFSRLKEFLHPLTGGHARKGWALGRSPCLSDFYALLEEIDGVDYIKTLSLNLTPSSKDEAEPMDVEMPPDAIVCNGEHKITVTYETADTGSL